MAHLWAQINVLTLSRPIAMWLYRLRTDLNIEQFHPFGTTTDRIRYIFVLYNKDFYILDELLHHMDLERLLQVSR